MPKKSQNISTDNRLAVQIIFIIFTVIAVVLFDKFSNSDLAFLDNNSKPEASLYIDFDNMKRTFQGEVVEGMTLLDALNAAVAAGNIDIEYVVDRENNIVLSQINDHRMEKNRKFKFFVNNQEVSIQDINKTSVHSGDQIKITL